jgi:hypothetical protein
MLAATNLFAQEEKEWIAHEGKILNYRTLTWNDFEGKEDPAFAKMLAEENLQARAYVSPRIYYYADSGQREGNGRVTFKFRVKCAFQSRAFARESTKQEHSNYVLIHEQDHYDIALTFANELQTALSSRDYSEKNYDDEMNKLTEEIQKRYYHIQETYDAEVNPHGTDDKPKQYLWDLRIRKCMENNSEEFYASPENALAGERGMSVMVKRIPNEPPLQFVVRARPMYVEMPEAMMTKVIETKEWTLEPAIIAFYSQKYYVDEDGGLPKYNYRSFGYLFMPMGKDSYKRMLIDTFSNYGKPVKIENAFFANVDSDNVKELVVLSSSQQKDAQGTGTLYINRAYDNIARPYPGRMRRMDDVCAKIKGGFEGVKDGVASKAKYKSEKEIREVLAKLGYK